MSRRDTFVDPDILILDEPQIIREYPNLWRSVCSEFSGLDLTTRIKILALATNVCGSCHDAPSGCQCWNDE